jgi:hypothetical protein
MTEPTDRVSGFPLREKATATALHFAASVMAVGTLLLLVTQLWYPDFLFTTDGGWQGLRIVVLVDVVLGPLLTFVVFRRGKKGLMMDLSLIVLLQLVALLGGGWVVHAERPLALVLYEGRFFSVTAGDYLDAGVPVPDMGALGVTPPEPVVFLAPESPIEQSPVRTAYVGRNQLIYTHVPWMRPWREHVERIRAAGRDRATLEETDADAARLVGWLEAQERTFETVAFVPYSSRFELIHLGVDRATGEIIAPLHTRSRYD